MVSTVKNRYTTNIVADHISSPRINVFFCLHRVLEKEAGTHFTHCYANFLERNHNKRFVDTKITRVISRSVFPPRWYLSTEPIFPRW